MPGGEGRLREPAPESTTSLANQLARDLTPYIDRPYAILGYNMGALLGFEIPQRWRTWWQTDPLAFFRLAAPPPQLSFKRALHQLPQAEFRQVLVEMGGLPPELLAEEEALATYEPILRKDFQNCDQYLCGDVNHLPCAIYAFVSDADTLLIIGEAKQWGSCTASTFELTTLQYLPHIIAKEALIASVRSISSICDL